MPFSVAGGSTEIRTVRDEAARAGIRVGDRLVAVGDEPYVGRRVLGRAIATAHRGDRLRMTLDRPSADGRIERIPVDVQLGSSAELDTPQDLALILVLGLITPLICLLLGFGVTAIRLFDPLAWLLLLLMLSFSNMVDFNFVDMTGWPAALGVPAIAYHTFFATAWPIWMLLFGIYFPARLEYDRDHPWIKWLLILPLSITSLLMTLSQVGDAERIAVAAPVDRLFLKLGPVPRILTIMAISTFFTCLGTKLGTETSPDARRRLRLLLWGAQVSLGPVGLLVIASLIFGREFTAYPPWLVYPALSLMALFPMTLAYIIVVQRALDVRVVIRQGLQYALARNAIRMVQIVVSIALTFITVTLIGNPHVNQPRRIQYIGLGVMFLVVAAARRGGERLRAWTDRKFFREAYNAEQILSDLGEQVRTMVETAPLLDTLGHRVADSLHVRRIAAVLKQNGTYVPVHGVGFDDGLPRVAFSTNGPLIARLVTERRPLTIYFDDPRSWINNEGIQEDERAGLRALDSQLLLPLTVTNDLLGFVSLGPKQSDEPYSASDLRLLQSVATQTGLALQNSRLTAAITAEVARRERQNREIEIAREVQEQLFPHTFPAVPGFEYAGRCRPALGVGGDYYDFLEVPGGEFAFAIGDVSGKGIPAALLMASLQASLRAQTIGGPVDLTLLITNLNRLIFEASAPNRYATFFYGQYHPSTHRLAYVNAGHNAPMVFRRSDGQGQIIRLKEGGPVIGLLDIARFTQASLALQPGDLLVAFTDGISEAMNQADEEWGEERLVAAVARCDNLPAEQMLTRLMAEADTFVAGAPQHDDMTMIVVRVH